MDAFFRLIKKQQKHCQATPHCGKISNKVKSVFMGDEQITKKLQNSARINNSFRFFFR
jgi:hypothetical protein